MRKVLQGMSGLARSEMEQQLKDNSSKGAVTVLDPKEEFIQRKEHYGNGYRNPIVRVSKTNIHGV